jgi:hypothetical protein
VVQPQWYEDDEQLMAQLRAALAGSPPPPSVVAAAKAVYAWRTVDAELAELAHDSALDRELTAVRSETAALRTLTFECATLVVELGVTDDAIVGQLVPPQAAVIEVREPDRPPRTVQADDMGCFRLEAAPTGSFSLHVRTQLDGDVVTDWVSLRLG